MRVLMSSRRSAKKNSPETTPEIPAKPKTFSKLRAANRSEIAIRVFRAATELGLRTVAIYAQEDRFGVHRFKADEAYLVGQGKGPVGAYLDIESIVTLAKERGVDLIHPGYGFLSENAAFARACAKAGITFVGPRPELLEMMGDKTAARTLAQKIGVPTLPGTEEPISDRAEALKVAKEIGFPLIIKAAFGGGGRGMRVVHKAGDLSNLLDEAQAEAGRAFGNPAVFLEKYIPNAKHIEVQILGDQHGNVIHRTSVTARCNVVTRRSSRWRRHSVSRSTSSRSSALPQRAWPTRCAMTTPARLNSSTTWTSTSGSSSR